MRKLLLLFLLLIKLCHMPDIPGYQICQLPSVEDGDKETNQLYCKNGIPATQENIQLGEYYEDLLSCYEYHSSYSCLMFLREML